MYNQAENVAWITRPNEIVFMCNRAEKNFGPSLRLFCFFGPSLACFSNSTLADAFCLKNMAFLRNRPRGNF